MVEAPGGAGVGLEIADVDPLAVVDVFVVAVLLSFSVAGLAIVVLWNRISDIIEDIIVDCAGGELCGRADEYAATRDGLEDMMAVTGNTIHQHNLDPTASPPHAILGVAIGH